jgi:hypothetical protein
MRSLWQDFSAVASALPHLQKVGDELAANSGHRSGTTAYTFSPHEVYMSRVEDAL